MYSKESQSTCIWNTENEKIYCNAFGHGNFVFAPKANAIDPVTMMVLAPIAIKVADAARPYIEKSLIGTGTGLLKIGKDVLHILYLPYGLLEVTLGAPFNKFRSGLVHMLRGGVIAPIRLILHTLILPVYMTGAQINI